MSFRYPRFLSCLLAMLATFGGAQAARADTALALRDGETLTYKVSWAVLFGAGEIKISAVSDNSGPAPRLVVNTTTATKPPARWLLKFDAESKSVFDQRTGRLLTLSESNRQNDKKVAHDVTFDYTKSLALYTPQVPDAKTRSLEMPPGDPMDLITSLLQTRLWDIKEGEKRDVLVLFDDDFYELTIHAARTEELLTPLGTFKTLVLEPRMDKTPPKGMFKKGSSVRVWISQDERRLPVKFEVEFKIGTGVATLIQYQPPTEKTAALNTPGSSAKE